MAVSRRSCSFAFIALCALAKNSYGNEDSEAHSRQARHLVFPVGGSKVQFIAGIGIPVQLPFQALTIGYVIKADYHVPDNGTQYTKPFEAFSELMPSYRSADANEERSRERRDLSLPSDRWDLYTILESFADRAIMIGRAVSSATGGVGRQCVLRAICETAASGFQHDGLLGEVLHVILTPSTTSEPMRSRRHIDYHTAERLGRSAESHETCGTLFSGCHTGALDLISTLLPVVNNLS